MVSNDLVKSGVLRSISMTCELPYAGPLKPHDFLTVQEEGTTEMVMRVRAKQREKDSRVV